MFVVIPARGGDKPQKTKQITLNARVNKKDNYVTALCKSYLRSLTPAGRQDVVASCKKFEDGAMNVVSLFSGTEIQRLCGEGLVCVAGNGTDDFTYNCFASSVLRYRIAVAKQAPRRP